MSLIRSLGFILWSVGRDNLAVGFTFSGSNQSLKTLALLICSCTLIQTLLDINRYFTQFGCNEDIKYLAHMLISDCILNFKS